MTPATDPNEVRRALRLPHSQQYLVERWALDKVAFAEDVLEFHPTAVQARYLRAHAKRKHACAGRRGGKSVVEAVDATHDGIFQKRSKFLNTARTYQQAMIIPNEAISLCARTPIGRTLIEDVDRSPFFRLRWITGTDYWARSLQNGGDNLRGDWYARVHNDEAAFGSRRDLNVILPTLADVNGEYSTTTTPNGLNWYHAQWTENERQQAREERRRAVLNRLDRPVGFGLYGVALLDHLNAKWKSADNPYLSAEALAELRANLRPDAVEQELNAEFLEVSGALCRPSDLYPVEDGGIRQDELDEGGTLFEDGYRGGMVCVGGCDLGRWQSYTVLVVLRIDTSPWHVVSIQAQRRDLWPVMQDRLEHEVERWRASVLFDATKGSVGDVIADFLNVPGDRFEFSKPSKEQLLLRLKLAIERRLLWIPNNEEMIRQLGLFGTDPDSDRGETWDYIMALALAVWQAEQNPGGTPAISTSGGRVFAGIARAGRIKRFPIRRGPRGLARAA